MNGAKGVLLKSQQFKETEIGKIPEDWEIKELGGCSELIIDYRGKTPKKLGGTWINYGIPAISARNIKKGEIVEKETIKYISEELYKKWMKDEIHEGDTILTSEGPLGEYLYWNSKEKIVLSQRLFAIRVNATILDPLFFYTFVSSELFQTELKRRATGTTVQGIRQSELIKTKVLVPPIQEQRSIAKILSDLDAKIELNRQMNKTLEQIGEALFKHWFVDFEFPNEKGKPYKSTGGEMVDLELGAIPKAWKVGRISDEFDLTMGQSPPGSSYNETGEGMVFFQGRTDFGLRFPSVRMFCTSPTRFANEGDTLVSVRAPVGDVNIALQRCCIGRGLAAIKHKTGSRSYTYYALRNLRPKFEHFEAAGTIFGAIGKTDFETLKILSPPIAIIQLFEKMVGSLDHAIENNSQNIRTLAKARDSLLPKLISGEIRIQNGGRT